MIFFNMNVMKKAFVAQDVGDVVIKSRCVLAPAVLGQCGRVSSPRRRTAIASRQQQTTSITALRLG
ncbi:MULTISPECIES: hypothetical protein [Herbaspirillum]|uniref:hypothetical protein n=1 Tax=Herbaspirillum TaxID=963 RepID=UPI0006527485|nr:MULTISPECIES: hypothetical protein [Herbaspirillum]AKN64479.1 hypothetical protein ACP92_04105 [Herbaspirillum seropedicae]UMU20409.1 hypothetical protein G5B88_04135 [Herbaspirillum seropedicae]